MKSDSEKSKNGEELGGVKPTTTEMVIDSKQVVPTASDMKEAEVPVIEPLLP